MRLFRQLIGELGEPTQRPPLRKPDESAACVLTYYGLKARACGLRHSKGIWRVLPDWVKVGLSSMNG